MKQKGKYQAAVQTMEPTVIEIPTDLNRFHPRSRTSQYSQQQQHHFFPPHTAHSNNNMAYSNNMSLATSHSNSHHSNSLPGNSAGAAEPNPAAMTRLLKEKMLEVCQEHVAFSDQVNILGVVTLTVDDGQEDLVVKFQHIFKKRPPRGTNAAHVSSTSGNGGVATPLRVPHVPSPVSSSAPSANSSGTNPLALNYCSPTVNGVVANGYASNGNANTTASERKSNGRKRAHPKKVIAQCDANIGSDEEDAITVIPEAPEMADNDDDDEADVANSVGKSQSRLMLMESGSSSSANHQRASGSAKRKPSLQFRVPQYNSSNTTISATSTPLKNSPHMRQALSSSPFDDSILGGVAPQNLSTNPTTTSSAGLSLPLYIAGNVTAGIQQNGGVINPIEITPENCTDSERDDPSRSPSKSPGDLFIDEDNPSSNATKVKMEERNNALFALSGGASSDAPLDFSRSGLQTMAGLYGLTTSGFDGVGTTMASQLPFSALNLLSSMRRQELASSSGDADGLSIKYTATGPYTVGANGKDVSNSSRIKDIIMYDEHSPFGSKGMAGAGAGVSKMEQDFIVDKLGMDGRKRRRRAPEDQLTPEEIAEYLGQPDVKTEVSFKCKYCTDVFDSVTKYIHHTLASHQAYICHQCGKSFTTKSSLLRHRPIHTGMRRFACSICKKTFYRKDKCKAHIKRHLGLDNSANAGGSGEATPISGADANQVAEAYNLSLDAVSDSTADNSMGGVPNLGVDSRGDANTNAFCRPDVDSAENSNSAPPTPSPSQFPGMVAAPPSTTAELQ